MALLALLVGVELLLVAVLLSPVFVDRQKDATAYFAWRANPTQETERQWQEERAITVGIRRRTRLIGSAICLMLLAANTAAIAGGAGLLKKRREGK